MVHLQNVAYLDSEYVRPIWSLLGLSPEHNPRTRGWRPGSERTEIPAGAGQLW